MRTLRADQLGPGHIVSIPQKLSETTVQGTSRNSEGDIIVLMYSVAFDRADKYIVRPDFEFHVHN